MWLRECDCHHNVQIKIIQSFKQQSASRPVGLFHIVSQCLTDKNIFPLLKRMWLREYWFRGSKDFYEKKTLIEKDEISFRCHSMESRQMNNTLYFNRIITSLKEIKINVHKIPLFKKIVELFFFSFNFWENIVQQYVFFLCYRDFFFS